MNDRKLLVFTKGQMQEARNGLIDALVENMLKLGASINRGGQEITSIQGPFDNKVDGETLFIINLKKTTENI